MNMLRNMLSKYIQNMNKYIQNMNKTQKQINVIVFSLKTIYVTQILSTKPSIDIDDSLIVTT